MNDDLMVIEPAIGFDLEAMQERRERERQAIRAILDAIYAPDYGDIEKERWQAMWDEQRELWLERFQSDHTRDAYGRALREFCNFLDERFAVRYLWFVEPDHAATWIKFMSTTGTTLTRGKPLSERTINLRVAAVSSYYTHMTMATRLVNGNQVGLFVSADGHHRLNPFRVDTVERPPVTPFGSSTPSRFFAGPCFCKRPFWNALSAQDLGAVRRLILAPKSRSFLRA